MDTVREPKPTSSETLFCEKFWRNRRGEVVVVEIKRFNGDDKANVIDIRAFFTARDGTLRPTPAGLCCSLRKLPDIKKAIDKALSVARDLGLIEAEAE